MMMMMPSSGGAAAGWFHLVLEEMARGKNGDDRLR